MQTTLALPASSDLYHRMERHRWGFGLLVLQEPRGHKTEPSEELVGPCAGRNPRGVCGRRSENASNGHREDDGLMLSPPKKKQKQNQNRSMKQAQSRVRSILIPLVAQDLGAEWEDQGICMVWLLLLGCTILD